MQPATKLSVIPIIFNFSKIMIILKHDDCRAHGEPSTLYRSVDVIVHTIMLCNNNNNKKRN